MQNLKELDPKVKKIIQAWFPMTMVLIRKMHEHCDDCPKNDCRGCKFIKLLCLLDEIDTILNEDNIYADYYRVFEEVSVFFTNLNDE